MQKAIKYVIFKTKWGYFGLGGTEYALCRTQLPGAKHEKIKSLLLKNLPAAQFDKNFCRPLQEQITAYFEGACIDFSNIPVALGGSSSFFNSVLNACRDIGFGRTISYSGLAEKTGRHAAARAVGSALAKNPMPLIIPCHRIICSDGKIGGFSAIGGRDLKAKLLKHEQTSRIICKSS
ncbi:MAG: methylated-DNA--[protein]-cysteine S-methyltransferase [Planctomycetes bacterium]|nr:methylated-DNA--[protein]-cysteine S-methyltransferase [Planctomycetota bacterium]